MRGPLFDRKMKGFSFYIRRGLFRIRGLLNGHGWHGVTVLEQDVAVKEALKGHFSVVRVKPGHGQEFLRQPDSAAGITGGQRPPENPGLSFRYCGSGETGRAAENKNGRPVLEQAYSGFVKEVLFWQKQGLQPR